MPTTPRYPLLVDLSGRACLVVGGGSVAARKVRGLLDAGAAVTVVAPTLGADLAAAVDRGHVAWRRTSLTPASVEGELFEADPAGSGWWFVVAATDDPAVNHAVVTAGERHGVWVNDVTDARGGPVTVPAVHRTGPVTVAVSTGGVSPSAAAWLRNELARAVDPAVVEALELLAEVVAEGSTEDETGRLNWRTVLDSGMLEDIREGRRAKAKERLKACLSSSSD